MAAVMHQRSSRFTIDTIDDFKAWMEEAYGVPYDELPEDEKFTDEEIVEIFLTGYRE